MPKGEYVRETLQERGTAGNQERDICARDMTEKRDGREETPHNRKRNGRETGHGVRH
jgi:hypothetical protein